MTPAWAQRQEALRIGISNGMLLGGEHFRILPGSSGVCPPEHRSVTRLRRRLP